MFGLQIRYLSFFFGLISVLSFFNIIYSYYLNLYLNLDTYYLTLIISLIISVLFYKIKLSEINKTIDLMISKTEIEKRLKKLKIKDNKVPRGYKKLYLESVLPATQGCDFDFL